MIKKLLLWPLAFLFALPGWACATGTSSKTAELPASFYSAAAKQIAESYVLVIKEKYADRQKDRDYLEAQLKYQIAAAKFSGLRSTIELEAIGGNRIPNVNDSKYQPMVMEALKSFDEFSAVSQRILLSSHDGNFSEQGVSPLNFSTVITDIFSFVSRFQELWVKQHEIRELRLKKLSVWIDQYYNWSNWDDIGIIAKTNTP
ncbi:hypothetical protein [Pelosinus fermentans]|uniref:Uncharacterized protein n=1 Tax=Pelosinus fermentans JBW45 TaxID=1192197 RepID=I9NT05_9FIRM|nr:hypothetical protein [Pelosinus fermentans]AJQ28860.1 hypothetical protein JBW_03521 [Pelosinus fermentans JBW45]